ncbi:MAG: PrsW family glutamic-type intramembrane protease [Bacteroidota bacterium]
MEQPLDVVILLALALAPVVFLFTYVYLRDEYEREPLIYLIITFILGLSTAFPVIWIEEQLHAYTNITMETSPLLYAFIYVALVEEGMKYLVLRWYNYPHDEFDEPYDGIMYGVAVSLGFAAIENVMYVYYSTGDPIETGIGRMFTAVPAHAMFGVLMGFFVGRAKFLLRGSRWLERLKGLGVAILFHGLYDYFLFLGNAFYVPFALFTLGSGIFLARKAIKMHAHISPHR